MRLLKDKMLEEGNCSTIVRESKSELNSEHERGGERITAGSRSLWSVLFELLPVIVVRACGGGFLIIESHRHFSLFYLKTEFHRISLSLYKCD